MFVSRENTKVVIRIDSKLGTCKPVFPLSFECGDQEYAELVARQLNKALESKINDAIRTSYNKGYKACKGKKPKYENEETFYSFE